MPVCKTYPRMIGEGTAVFLDYNVKLTLFISGVIDDLVRNEAVNG